VFTEAWGAAGVLAIIAPFYDLDYYKVRFSMYVVLHTLKSGVVCGACLKPLVLGSLGQPLMGSCMLHILPAG
jgi:hypothetical protein